MKHLLATSLLFFLAEPVLQAAEMPTSAEIVDVPAERRDWAQPIGNVRVKFSDGHTEMWTKQGKCMHVRRAASGLVGWSRYTKRNAYCEPINNVLRIMVTTESWKDFQAGPFIEDWGFADSDTTLVVKSRGRHGPSTIRRFSLKSGQLIASTKGSVSHANLPDWAKPFADDQPLVLVNKDTHIFLSIQPLSAG